MVAFGGGSALDVGKLIAFMPGQTRPVWDFEDIGDWWTRADADAIAPVVAVPTTAGTGSEVGRAGGRHQREDPHQEDHLPSADDAEGDDLRSGADRRHAADHHRRHRHGCLRACLEAYCGPSYHPLADGIAVEGVRLVKENLVTAVKDGNNIEARAHMMAAAAMGATAFQKALGAIHALSHPVGALYDTHHGLTNGVFMPYVLAFNRKAIEDKIVRLAAYIGLRPSFRAFMDFVLELREETGVPHTLAGLNVGDDKVDTDRRDGAEGPDRRRQSGEARQARRAHDFQARAGRAAIASRKTRRGGGDQRQAVGCAGPAHGP